MWVVGVKVLFCLCFHFFVVYVSPCERVSSFEGLGFNFIDNKSWGWSVFSEVSSSRLLERIQDVMDLRL